MTTADSPRAFEPRWPLLVALAVFLAAALALCWPMLSGQFLLGDDQLMAGYSFRLFGTEMLKATGHVPQWNPYIFGGIPFIAAEHGDIFYPTALLRLLVGTEHGMTLGMFFHLAIAGTAMYALLRGLKASWIGAAIGGLAYELSGNVASTLNPGHDGKLFVAALAPFAFLALLRAIRHGRISGYGLLALIVGLCMVSPHSQMTYYLLVALGIFTIWLAFFDPERRTDRSGLIPMAAALVAVGIGVGIGMVQALPFLEYIPYSPRAPGGGSVGWEYATSYALPIEELMQVILPHFNGIGETYWGQNFFRSHTEYLGAIVLTLAIIGLPSVRKRGLLAGFGWIAGLFLLVSLGAHTPFYRVWYNVMPMMSHVRAPAMSFYLVGLTISVWAGFGVDRLLAGGVSSKKLYTTLGVLFGLAVFGVAGILQSVAEGIATSIGHATGDDSKAAYMIDHVVANQTALQTGSMRLLLVVLLGGAVLLLIQRRMLTGMMALGGLVLAVGADNVTILHNYSRWYAPASVLFRDDQLTTAMKKTPLPFRAYDPGGDRFGPQFGVYQGSILMAHHVPGLLGYHGMESRYFDDLLGVKNLWMNQLSPNLLDLFAVQYLILNRNIEAFPGFHKVVGPVPFENNELVRPTASVGVLFERDSAAKWVRILPAGVKVPNDTALINTVVDSSFPVNTYVLFPDSSKAPAGKVSSETPAPTTMRATVKSWAPGAMTIGIDGSDTRTTFLLVAENWYPDWHAKVDGKDAPVYRGDETLITVALPPGSREVTLVYDSKAYHQGTMITLVCLSVAVLLLFGDKVRRRTADA